MTITAHNTALKSRSSFIRQMLARMSISVALNPGWNTGKGSSVKSSSSSWRELKLSLYNDFYNIVKLIYCIIFQIV